MNKAVRQIACTQCGAPLALHGGHRSRGLTCGYCGALMDSQHDYQIVQRYKNEPRPDVPLKIGMQAQIKGVDFTLIGMVEYLSEDIDRWVDFCLYSPTHGYQWLTYNNGHYVFSRRVRTVPTPETVQHFSPKMRINAMDRTFLAYEQYEAKIVYVEGELTWLAKRGDTIQATEAIAPPYIFSYETSDNELEYNLGEYLPAKDVHQAFGLEPPAQTKDVHPAQPYVPNPLIRSSSLAAKYHLIVALILVLGLLLFGRGKVVFQQYFDFNDHLEKTSPVFHIDNGGDLLELKLRADVHNNWGFYNVEIYNKNNDEAVYSLAEEIAYYAGYEDGESWSEGSHSAEALFFLPAGDYYAQISGEGENAPSPNVTLTLHAGVMVSRYFIGLAGLMLLLWLWLPIRRQLYEQKRWQPILGDEDDE
jgi:hypothetical protein